MNVNAQSQRSVAQEFGAIMLLPYVIGIIMIVVAMVAIAFSRTVTDVSSVGFRYTANLVIPGLLLVATALSIERLCNDAPKASYGYLVVIAILIQVMPSSGYLDEVALIWLLGVALFIVVKTRRLAMGLRWSEPEGVQSATRVALPATAEGSEGSEGSRSAYPARLARHGFDAVMGMEPLKRRLDEAGREILMAHGQGKTARNGILLSGDPGNGKSFIAEALAGHLNLPFLPIDIGAIESKWVGQKVEQLKAVFDEARRQAPCVLFFDEADSMLMDRSNIVRGDSDDAKAVNTLLTELVEIRQSGVLVIAATNYPDKLDAAALREGRFDFKIEISAPDAPARRGLILRATQAFQNISLEASALEQAIKRWEGFSVARINTVIDEAGRVAQKSKARSITYADLQQALRTVQGRKGKLPEDTPRIAELSMEAAQKNQLLSIAARMRDIATIEEMGGSVPTGMLFHGAPGTGKTLTARALAKDSGWAFLATCGADLLAKPESINQLLRDANDMRPCILFIDEADDVCADRRMSGQFNLSITNKLLAAMDGAGGKSHDVVWIAATNHPDNFDPAMLRRFTEKVEFQLPDNATLCRFIVQWIAQSKAQFDRTARPEVLAMILEGQSIANVQQTLQQAANLAVNRGLAEGCSRATVSLADVENALEIVA